MSEQMPPRWWRRSKAFKRAEKHDREQIRSEEQYLAAREQAEDEATK